VLILRFGISDLILILFALCPIPLFASILFSLFFFMSLRYETTADAPKHDGSRVASLPFFTLGFCPLPFAFCPF